MKNKIMLLIISIFIVATLSNNVLAWGPHTHDSLSNSIFNSDNPIGQLCNSTPENKAAYELGSVTPDITVIYYYTNGGNDYRLTHNWNFDQEIFAQALTDDEKCFAYGIASHLIADSIAHTQAVPAGIRASKLPNWVAHPMLEKKYDSYLTLKNPGLMSSTAHMMDAMYGPKGERYIQMIQNAIGANSDIDVKANLIQLDTALGGNSSFYSSQFAPQGQSFIFKLYPYIDKFTNFLAPIIGSTNSVKMNNYYDESEQAILNTFNNWGARYELSPHGFTELSAANQDIGISTTIIIILIFAAPIALAFVRKNAWYLAFIPLLLIIGVVVAYCIL
jgi:hypothetical protein